MACYREEAHLKYFDPAEAPPLVLDEAPIARDRVYNREQLPWQEEQVSFAYDGVAVYRNYIAPSTLLSARAKSSISPPKAYAPRSRSSKSAANSIPV